jgi:uncharacterized membrane protein YeaQ/YmgE (transglycosylase-associated protein family)
LALRSDSFVRTLPFGRVLAPRAARSRTRFHSKHLLFFLLFGLVVGAVARMLVPGRESGGWLTSLVLGVLGSFVGGFLGRGFGYADGRPAGFLMSLLGAVLLLVAYHLVGGRKAAT